MHQTNEREKVTKATENDTVELMDLDDSSFRVNNIQQVSGERYENKDVHGNAVQYLAWGTCSLLGTQDGLVSPQVHQILFRLNSDYTLFLKPSELKNFGTFVSSAVPPKGEGESHESDGEVDASKVEEVAK